MEEIIEEERDEDMQDITGDELLENKDFVNQGHGEQEEYNKNKNSLINSVDSCEKIQESDSPEKYPLSYENKDIDL